MVEGHTYSKNKPVPVEHTSKPRMATAVCAAVLAAALMAPPPMVAGTTLAPSDALHPIGPRAPTKKGASATSYVCVCVNVFGVSGCVQCVYECF